MSMKTNHFLELISQLEMSEIDDILNKLEDIFPELVWFYEDEILLIKFPLNENRKHTVLIQEIRLGEFPRVWTISARVGEADKVESVIGNLNDYNSVYPFGSLVRDDKQAKLYVSLIKSITKSKDLIYSAYMLATQADNLEKLCFKEDIN
jgi:hypothetical protein